MTGRLPGQDAGDQECHGDACVTCGDTAVVVTVQRLLRDELALVDTGQRVEEVSVALVSAAAGDTILVHAGEAIAVVSRAQRVAPQGEGRRADDPSGQ
jgi:hydrogenase expression/formation protein HypC